MKINKNRLKRLIESYVKKALNEAPPEGWHGTARAMITKHPEKFQEPGEKKKTGEINPYALAHAMEKKGAEPHYKEQETSLKGKPEKKEKFKKENVAVHENVMTLKQYADAAFKARQKTIKLLNSLTKRFGSEIDLDNQILIYISKRQLTSSLLKKISKLDAQYDDDGNVVIYTGYYDE
jgi:hypothetical protein